MANSTKRLYESLYHTAPLNFQNYPILLELEDQVAEFMKCRKDPVYFMDTYGVIKDPIRGLIPFNLYDFQKETLRDLLQYQYTIFLKSRQMGVSTLTAGFACWLACFWPHQTIVIISIKQDTAIDFLKKIKMIYSHLPAWIKPYPEKWNEAEIEFDNGSRIVGSTTTGEAARSGSLSLLIVDEAAFIPKVDKTWASAQPTLAKGGRGIVISCVTPDTYVFTSEGVKQVGDFAVQNEEKGYEIPEYEVLGKDRTRRGVLFFNNGEASVRKLYTKYAELSGSHTHKLWACKAGEFRWFRLEELEVGDWVSIQYGSEIWGSNDDVSDYAPSKSKNPTSNKFQPTKITQDIAYFLGLFLAEGSSYKKLNEAGSFVGASITLTCGDDLSEVFSRLGISYSSHDNLHYTVGSKELFEFLEYLGFDLSRRAPDKVIPSRLLKMSRDNIVAMLQGIFDGDGWSRKDRGQVGIGLSSLTMLKQIRILLLNFGILTSYGKFDQAPTKKVKASSTQHRLECTSSSSRVFYDKIGFRFERKQLKRSALEGVDFFRASSRDVIPFGLSVVRELFSRYEGNKADLRKTHGLNLSGVLNDRKRYKTEHISRQNVLALWELVGKPSEYSDRLSENLMWVPITQLEDLPAQEVYDFSLFNNPEDEWAHSVVYNGLLGEQTPNGVGNFYHELWVNSVAGKSNTKPIELHWTLHPDYDQDWYEDQRRRLGSPRRVAQELDLQFIGSGDTVLPGEVLSHYLAACESPVRVTDDDVMIWEDPKEDEEYIIGADVASGGGTDYSTFQVIKKSTLEQVAEFQKKILPNRFAKLLKKYGEFYNYAQMVVEVNGYGLEVNDRLFNEHGYEMLFVEKNSKVGWKTSVKSRPLIISALESLLGSRKFNLKSKRLFNELSTFIWNGAKAEGMNGANDDLVMALGIALAVYVRENIQYAGFEEDFVPIAPDQEEEMEAVLENFRVGNEEEEDKTDDISWLRAR